MKDGNKAVEKYPKVITIAVRFISRIVTAQKFLIASVLNVLPLSLIASSVVLFRRRKAIFNKKGIILMRS